MIQRLLFLAALLVLLTTCKKDREWNNLYDANSGVDPQEWAPSDLMLSVNSLTSISLIWECDQSQFEGFKIDRKIGDGEWVEAYANLNSDLREWIDTLVEPDTTFIYQYRLYSFANLNKSESKLASAEVSFPYPTGITTTKLTDVSYKLNWTDNSNGEDGFKIDRKTGEEWVLAYGTTLPNETEFIDTNVFANKSGIDLQYRVYGFYKNTKSRSISTSVNAQLTAPINLTITVNSQTSLTLNWIHSGIGHQGFKIDRKDKEGNWQENFATVVATQQTYTDNNVSFTTNDGYTYRVYAYNYQYVSEKSETYIFKPTVVTSSVSAIMATSATSGGEVTDSGGATVTTRGVVWSSSQNPTIENHQGITSSETGTGSWVSELVGLSPVTTYYVRAYVASNVGSAYGSQLSFTTSTPPAEVTNPTTGKTWLDRNLGASRVAQSSTDVESYGDLYQWGRGADGHEKRNSGTTSTLSISNTPEHGNFILAPNSPYDWLSPQNTNLWQGVNGINNPCPCGFRIPTEAEWNAERASWSSNNSSGAFVSPLKLPIAGNRYYNNGSLSFVGSEGFYWSSSVDGTFSRIMQFNSSGANMYSFGRAFGISIRCIKD